MLKAWAPSMTSLRNTKHATFKEDNISSKVVECAVVGCSNKTPRDSKRWISFRRLPLKISRFLRWLDWIFRGNTSQVWTSTMSAWVEIWKKSYHSCNILRWNFLMIWVFVQSESPWQRYDAITFFIYLGVSLYQEFFKEIGSGSMYLP